MSHGAVEAADDARASSDGAGGLQTVRGRLSADVARLNAGGAWAFADAAWRPRTVQGRLCRRYGGRLDVCGRC